MKSNLFYFLAFIALISFNGNAQGKKSSVLSNKKPSDNIYMTWNKSTPETEMSDDIKALAEHGVTIKYSNVKRNDKGEITAIKVEYNDTSGNKGALEFDNQKPINTIKFFKQDDEVGFGDPSGNENSFFTSGFGNPNTMEKAYSFNFNDDNPLNGQGFGQSKMIIQKDGKKPLVLQDGKIIEGGDDYTAEELEEIKKNNKMEFFHDNDDLNFNFNQNGSGFDDMAEQMKKMQEQIDQMMAKNGIAPSEKSKKKTDDLDSTKDEMQKAKQEMLDAKKEMEKAKKELEKAKSTLKTQKA
jgi:hypothetical protein